MPGRGGETAEVSALLATASAEVIIVDFMVVVELTQVWGCVGRLELGLRGRLE
jgi:hypothetical protein